MNYPPEFYAAIGSGLALLTVIAEIVLHVIRYTFPIKN